ncbi:MAG: hypothetical protein PUF46_05860, partial [Oscillospiraceae bacterium]|nr:hypothetical protein [Oscillospiraceae bacterium]
MTGRTASISPPPPPWCAPPGADAISVLTEPKWFLGSDEYLQEIAAAVSVPCL